MAKRHKKKKQDKLVLATKLNDKPAVFYEGDDNKFYAIVDGKHTTHSHNLINSAYLAARQSRA